MRRIHTGSGNRSTLPFLQLPPRTQAQVKTLQGIKLQDSRPRRSGKEDWKDFSPQVEQQVGPLEYLVWM